MCHRTAHARHHHKLPKPLGTAHTRPPNSPPSVLFYLFLFFIIFRPTTAKGATQRASCRPVVDPSVIRRQPTCSPSAPRHWFQSRSRASVTPVPQCISPRSSPTNPKSSPPRTHANCLPYRRPHTASASALSFLFFLPSPEHTTHAHDAHVRRTTHTHKDGLRTLRQARTGQPQPSPQPAAAPAAPAPLLLRRKRDLVVVTLAVFTAAAGLRDPRRRRRSEPTGQRDGLPLLEHELPRRRRCGPDLRSRTGGAFQTPRA